MCRYFNIFTVVSKALGLKLIILPINLIAAICILVLAAFSEGAPFNNDANIGLFGWFNVQHLWASMYLIVCAGGVGIFGYAFALNYFSPMVVSLTCLLEPIIGSFLAVIFKQDTFPSFGTICGGIIIFISVLVLLIEEERRKNLKPSQDDGYKEMKDEATLPLARLDVKHETLGGEKEEGVENFFVNGTVL